MKNRGNSENPFELSRVIFNKPCQLTETLQIILMWIMSGKSRKPTSKFTSYFVTSRTRHTYLHDKKNCIITLYLLYFLSNAKDKLFTLHIYFHQALQFYTFGTLLRLFWYFISLIRARCLCSYIYLLYLYSIPFIFLFYSLVRTQSSRKSAFMRRLIVCL